MKNKLFKQTTDTERLQKLDSVIRERANDALSEDQIQALVNSIGSEEQHSIVVYTDPCEFTGALSSRRNEDEGCIAFGPVQFAKSLMRNCYVGILEKPDEPAAAVIVRNAGGRRHYYAHIYLPQRPCKGGGPDE